MTDPTDIELNRMCGELYIPLDLLPETDMTREDGDGLDFARGILNAFLFTVCAGLLFFFGAVIVRGFQ